MSDQGHAATGPDGRPLGEVTVNEHGLYAAFVRPSDLVHMACAFDLSAGLVVLEGHSPLFNDWTRLAVPMSRSGESSDVRVRRIAFDAALTPAEFRSFAETAGHAGIWAWQCGREEPPSISIWEKEGAALVAAMRGLDIRLKVQYPGKGDVASIASHDEAEVRAALARMEAAA